MKFEKPKVRYLSVRSSFTAPPPRFHHPTDFPAMDALPLQLVAFDERRGRSWTGRVVPGIASIRFDGGVFPCLKLTPGSHQRVTTIRGAIIYYLSAGYPWKLFVGTSE